MRAIDSKFVLAGKPKSVGVRRERPGAAINAILRPFHVSAAAMAENNVTTTNPLCLRRKPFVRLLSINEYIGTHYRDKERATRKPKCEDELSGVFELRAATR